MLTWIRDTIINVNTAICISVPRITGTAITIDAILREREREGERERERERDVLAMN